MGELSDSDSEGLELSSLDGVSWLVCVIDEDISSPEAGLLLVVPDPVPLLDEPLPLPDPEPELDCAPETAEPLFWSFEGTLSLLRLLICDWSCFFDF